MIPDPRFLRYYEQELRFVRDLAGEFASEHARIANRFGLDQDSCADPHVEWLLDGFAFLAARVQHKFDGDYAVFTQHLLNMVYPDALAPTPATCVVAFTLAPDAAIPETGCPVPRSTRLTARPVPGEATRCTFTTAHDVTLWPIDLVAARYLGAAAAAEAGVPDPWQAKAALALTLRTRGGVPFAGLALDRLVLHLGSRDRIAHALFEVLAGHVIGLAGRTAGRGPPQPLAGGVERLGFSDAEALLPQSPRGYAGYRLLREYFVLPERFLFVALTGLAPLVRAAASDTIELLLSLDSFTPALESAVTESQFVLHATPAINLFPRRAMPILPTPADRDLPVVGDRLRPLDYEIHSITEVTGHAAEGQEVVRFEPFHGTPDGSPTASVAYYGIERRGRLATDAEDRAGAARSAYLGSDVFLTLADTGGRPLRDGLRRIDVATLCTNRDLPLRMLLPHGEAHFSVDAGGPIAGAQVIGLPSRPALPWASSETGDGAPWGNTAWHLLGLLALNYHSVVAGPDGRGADALRSLLALHAVGMPPHLARQVDGITGVSAETVTRRLPQADAVLFGRGLEITLDLTEGAFPDGSAFLLASVLEAFFRRQVTLNSFTETVLRTSERGEVKRFPALAGWRHLL